MPLPDHVATIDRQPAADRAYQQLIGWIEDGTLAPGETIQDTEIARALGVSRTPIREALQRLEQIGLVEVVPGRSSQVTPMDLANWRDIYEPLIALESLAAARAAERASPEAIARLNEIHIAFVEAFDRSDHDDVREVDRLFHQTVLEASGNPYLAVPVAALEAHRRRLNITFELRPKRSSIGEHAALLAAIERHDARGAAETVNRNWESAGNRLDAAIQAGRQRSQSTGGG